MSETPIKGLKKFQTISTIDKTYKASFSITANRLSQKRKSNSVLVNPQSILSITLPKIQDITLPKIQQKKKIKKQGNYLQTWLDEALGAPDPFMNQKPRQQQKVQSNILKSLKKYQLDRRHLQSQNIPGQKVQKLYQSLYIYSHGVNHIFQQLIKITKDSQYPDLIGNFWRAYTKLLQSCTSYQTVFQKVQKDHLANIKNLRSHIEKRSQNYQQQRKQFQLKIIKLQKIIDQKDLKYAQLKGQYQVSQNTLQLTDDAFNQQVNLRLKFEEKINAIYTYYQQLKAKYTKLVEDMSIKNSDIVEGQNKQNMLKNQLALQKTKVQELMFLLNVEKERVKQRQAEVMIKNQQLQDANTKVLARSNQQDKTQDKMQEYLSKFKALKSKLNEVQNVVRGQKLTINEQQQQIKKLSKTLQYYKEQNNQLYIKYSNSGKKIVQLQSKIEQRNIKIFDLQKTTILKGGQVMDLNRQLQHTKNQRDNLRNQLCTATRNLKDTKDTMSKNNDILQQLKAIKDKYERINQYLRIEIDQLQFLHNKTMEDLRIKTQQLQGMRLLLDNRNKTLIQAQKTIQQERELNRIKVATLNATIAKKQSLTLQYQKKSQQLQRNLINWKSEIKLLEEKCMISQSAKIKLQVQLDRKSRLISDLQDVLVKQNNRFKQISSKLQGQLKQKTSINSKLTTTQFVLKTKNQQERVQVQSLSSLLSQYKTRLIQRSQYIHPMVYQQLLQVTRRCQSNKGKTQKQLQDIKKHGGQLEQKIKSLQIEFIQTKKKTEEFQKQIKKIKLQKAIQFEQKTKAQQKCKKLQNNLIEMTKNYQQQFINRKSLSYQLQELKFLEKNSKQKAKLLQQQLFKTKQKLDKLQIQIKKINRSQASQAKRQKQIKKQVKQIKLTKQIKQTKQYQVQTQMIQQLSINLPLKQQEIQQVKINKQDKQIQTDNFHKAPQNYNQIFEPYNINKYQYHQVHKQVEVSTGRKQRQRQRQDNSQRKIQNNEFKRALKLTYMRR